MDIPIIKLFAYKNKFFFYDTFNNTILEVSKSQYLDINELLKIGIEKFRILQKETNSYKSIVHLIEKGYLKSSFITEISNPSTPYVDNLLNSCINDISLQVTRNCNFRCRYCLYTSRSGVERTHEHINMSWEVAKKSIDFLYDHSSNSNRIHISFYGGEPFLNFELIKRIVCYAEDKFYTKTIEYSTTINGSILSEEIIDFIIDNRFNIAISLDGPKKIQDSHRKFEFNGSGTFDTVFGNIMRLKSKDAKYYFDNVTFIPVYFDDEQYGIVSDFFKSIGISNEKAFPQKAYLNGIDYTNSYLLIEKNNNARTNKMDRHFFSAVYSDKTQIPSKCHPAGPCIPAVKRMFVDIYGHFYPCEKILENKAFVIGSVNKGFDTERIRSFMNIGLLTEENCKNCWAFRFCDLCIAHCLDPVKNGITKEMKEFHCKYIYSRTMNQIKQYIDEILEKR